jgi:hypothetical protein
VVFIIDATMVILKDFISRLHHWWKAKTIYSIHSPFIYDYLRFVFDRNRIYYAFIAINSKASYKQGENLDKNRKQNSRLTQKEKENLYLIYRHIIYSQSECVGFQNIDPEVMAYLCAMAGVKSLINLGSEKHTSVLLSGELRYGSTTIEYLNSIKAYRAQSKSMEMDLTIFKNKSGVGLENPGQIVKNVSDNASCLILNPYSLNKRDQKMVEKEFPLVLRSYRIQVLWKKQDLAPQKIEFTPNAMTKPWELIHAI